ncbi:MAG: extensin family protein [Brevundimonas sp.]|uniref:extensin-like domain-containing protein n=1 Tax=Brevundimonas sp. TaxID=1871086 RepID=UPI0039192CD8
MRRDLANFWTGLSLLTLAACGGFLLLDRFAPPQDLPWTPLDLNQPIGMATSAKVARLDVALNASEEQVEVATETCMALLRDAGVQVSRAADRNEGGFCIVQGAVRLTGGTTPLAPAGVVMQCPMAVRHVLWDRHVIQPAALEIMGAEASRIDNLGTYACRRVYGSQSPTDRPSQHARANALDVAGIRLDDGRTVSVLRDWDGEGPAGPEAATFLRRLRDGGCRLFGNVLTPDYNAAHADHFHVDAARRGICARSS